MKAKFDNSFYIKLLDYLEENRYLGAGFHYNLEYDCLGNDTGNYIWYIEDRNLGGSFPTLKEVVEDILNNFINIPSRDY
jgi:hypothetical protein